MKKMLTRLWKDESGFVDIEEWVVVAAAIVVVALGLYSGLLQDTVLDLLGGTGREVAAVQ